MTTSLPIHLRLSTAEIEHKISALLIDQLSETKLDINGFDVTMQSLGQVKLRGNMDDILIKLPLDIHLIRPSGLFTIEGKGQVTLTMKSNLQFDKSGQLRSNTTLEEHEWINRPSLQLGSLKMSVETLINMILNHAESLIVGKIDQIIREEVHIKETLQAIILEQLTEDNPLGSFGLGLRLQVDHLRVVSLLMDQSELISEINIYGSLLIHQAPSEVKIDKISIDQELGDMEGSRHEVHVLLDIPFQVINKALPQLLSGVEAGGKPIVIEKAAISSENHMIVASAEIVEPAKIKALVTFKAIIQGNKLNAENLDIDLKAENLLYKMAVPIIKKVIENRIEDLLPLNFAHLILGKIPQGGWEVGPDKTKVVVKMDDLQVPSLIVDDTGIRCSLIGKETEIYIS